jgi:hypothetical protein
MTATVVCPHCRFSKEIPLQKLPPEGTWATCPKCSQKFVTSGQTVLRQQEAKQQITTPVAEMNTDLYTREQGEETEQEYQEDNSYLLEQQKKAPVNERDILSSDDTPSVLALKRKSDIYLIGYLAALILLSFLEIDDDSPIMYFINVISALIPSISATASLSPNPNCAKLILLTCWITVIPLYFICVKNIRTMTPQGWNLFSERMCRYAGIKNVVGTYILLMLCTLPILYGIYFYNPLGGYSWRRIFLYKLIHSSNIFMPFWGVCITFGVWAILVVISIMTYGIITKRSK